MLSESVFHQHGLSEVDIDNLPLSDISVGIGHGVLSGTAIYNPSVISSSSFTTHSSTIPSPGALSPFRTISHPQRTIPTTDPTQRVSFSVCTSQDACIQLAFRKTAWFMSIASDTSSHYHTLDPQKDTAISGEEEEKSSVFAQILGWISDSYGLWMIYRPQKGEVVRLTDWWSQANEEIEMAEKRIRDENARTEDELAQVQQFCGILAGVGKCIQSLHEIGIALPLCVPSLFDVYCDSRNPGAHSSSNRNCVSLSSHGHLCRLDPKIIDDPSRAAYQAYLDVYFPRGHNELLPSTLDIQAIRTNISILAPEVSLSGQPSSSGDVFSLGNMAYTLLSGSRFKKNGSLGEAVDQTIIDSNDKSFDVLNALLDASGSRKTPLIKVIAERRSIRPNSPYGHLCDIVMRCLARDPDERYTSMDSLLHDIRKVGAICANRGDLSKFTPGASDSLARISWPDQPIERDSQLSVLDRSWRHACSASEQDYDTEHDTDDAERRSRNVIVMWGDSGSGKSFLAQSWTRQKASGQKGKNCLFGMAKVDEQSQIPLSTFTQVFESILSHILTDPREDTAKWRRQIKEAAGLQWDDLLLLLGPATKKLLGSTAQTPIPAVARDWANYLQAFILWSKRVIQLFGTKSRPLLLVLDDLQWLPVDERKLWQELLAGNKPLSHIFVISIFRVEKDEEPKPPLLICPGGESIHVDKLDEDSVRSVIERCFHYSMTKVAALAAYISAEIDGNMLFLRTLLISLVSAGVIQFDYAMSSWKYDIVRLHDYLSQSEVDVYLQRLINALPPNVIGILKILSCLPAAGVDEGTLADLSGLDVVTVRMLCSASISDGTILTTQRGRLRLAHDKPRMVAYRLMDSQEAQDLHMKISVFWRQEKFAGDGIFESAEQLLLAQGLGSDLQPLDESVQVLLEATSRSALAACFAAARRFLKAVERVFDGGRGRKEWAVTRRSTYLEYLTQATNVYGVLEEFDDLFQKLDEMVPLCEDDVSKIQLATLRIRLLTTATRQSESIALTWSTLRELGYDPLQPQKIAIEIPQNANDVIETGNSFKDNNSRLSDETEKCLILALMSHAAPTIYKHMPDTRRQFFAMGYALAASLRKVDESTALLMTSHAITITDVSVRKALCNLATELCDSGPSTLFSSSALVAIAAQAHCWMSLEDVAEPMTRAFDIAMATGNFENVSATMSLDVASRIFSSKPLDWNLVSRRQEAVREYVPLPFRIMINAPIQYSLRVTHYYNPGAEQRLEGSLLTHSDMTAIESFPFHRGICNTLSLRLAIFYDSSPDVTQKLIDDGDSVAVAVAGTVYGVERAFLVGVHSARYKSDRNSVALQQCLAELQRHSASPDFAHRINVLIILQIVHQSLDFTTVKQAGRVIQTLNKAGEHVLSGLVSYHLAGALLKATDSLDVAAGHLCAAFKSYHASGHIGLCQYLSCRYPTVVPSAPLSPDIPWNSLGLDEQVPLSKLGSHGQSPTTCVCCATSPPSRRQSRTEAVDESGGIREIDLREISTHSRMLDALTLARFALTLASQTDSTKVLSALTRILCQCFQADFAATALCENPADIAGATVRLRAAGNRDRVSSFDIDLKDPSAQIACPASVMLNVAGTLKEITDPTTLERLYPDPFLRHKPPPRRVQCLPVVIQGECAAVVYLSSGAHVAKGEIASMREIVQCLAMFATTIALNQSLTRHLEGQISQRTSELSSALATKTRFLSQCSHELRSPLSAILGLTAVLEASPGLSAVQTEHLHTIIGSGEHLLGLINNILDHSRLESGSLKLERIPFNLRDVVEGALETVILAAQQKGLTIYVQSSLANDPPGLNGDSFRIKQVLINLLANAVKFTSKGVVTISWSHEQLPDGNIRVRVDVRDTGLGIPSNRMDMLFKSFSQVDESVTRSYGGTGLVISRDIARLHGGDCSVESTVGLGSVFTFTFIAAGDHAGDVIFAPVNLASCLVICQSDPHREVLLANLQIVTTARVTCQDDIGSALLLPSPGETANPNHDVIMVSMELATPDAVLQLRQSQPRSKILLLVDNIHLIGAIHDYSIEREDILARPFKARSLHSALEAVQLRDTPKSSLSTRKRSKVNRNLSKECPINILLVDDNPTNLIVGRKILEMFGYTHSITAADGLQAVEAAEQRRFDLILLDLQMPVMDGYTAQKRIATSPLTGAPAVIALTANADRDTQEACESAGFDGFLTKPLDVAKLQGSIIDVFTHKQQNRREIAT